ncbi:MAG: MFS transporter, partial [Rhodospirillales bacterium]|nr:MFS transporter [Rhodospirillales bacterium]
SVFHPADLSILTASIRRTRHGRAYGFHTLGGNLGYALAPIVMVGLALELGWRSALVVAGAGGFALLLVLLFNRHLFLDASDEAPALARPRVGEASAADANGRGLIATVRHGVAPLVSVPVLLCFAFFIFLSGATIGLQSFFPALMDQLYGLPVAEGAPLLSVFLFGASGGVLLGGFLAERTSSRHQLVIGAGLASAAAFFVAISLGLFPAAVLGVPFALAGILVGLTFPSRDMLVREAAAADARGRVFGFVYSGLDTGAAVAPLIVGLLLDHGDPRAVMWLIAALLLLGVVAAALAKGRQG